MLIDMFSIGANEKNIQIYFICDDSIPEEIITDEQRLM
jgi:hypothetical protein